MPETPFTDTAASAFKLRTTGEDRPVGRIGENTRPVDQSPFFHQHGGPRPERRPKAAKQGDGCGRHGFAFAGERTDGNAFEQFQYRRSRNGYDAVGANDLTVRNGQGLTTNRAGESRVNRTQAIQMSRMLSSAPTS